MNLFTTLQELKPYYKYYLIFLALFLATYALLEFLLPVKVVRLWNRFVQTRFFPFYGLILIFAAFPLTQFYSKFSGKLLFIPGILIALSGPFIILFPDSFRSALSRTSYEAHESEIKQMAYFDAILRLVVVTLIILVLYV